MRRNLIESLMAAVVLAVAAVFLVFALGHRLLQPPSAIRVTARFTDVGGLKEGAAVRIHGIAVGRVATVRVDPLSLMAVVDMDLLPGLHLPTDSQAVITMESLVGAKTVSLLPGDAPLAVGDGGRLTHTQAYRSLETTVGRVVFQSGLHSRP